MHDNDAQPPHAPAPARRGQSRPVWLPIGGATSISQPAPPSFLESGRPAVARAPLLSALRGNSRVDGEAGVCEAAHQGGPRALASCAARAPRASLAAAPGLGACARQRCALLPVLRHAAASPSRTVKATMRENRKAKRRRQGVPPAPSHNRTTLRRTQPAHVAKPPVRSEGSSPPSPTPVLVASVVTPPLFPQR